MAAAGAPAAKLMATNEIATDGANKPADRLPAEAAILCIAYRRPAGPFTTIERPDG
jgi:hypothetical protein